jgi:hypothetical protein
MKSNNEKNSNNKKSRFEFKQLEPRIAPGAALAGLEKAVDNTATAQANAPDGQFEFVLGNVLAHNPQSGPC